MAFAGMNYVAIFVAAVAGIAAAFAWYAILGKAWLRALGKTDEELKFRALPFAISVFASFLMAYVLAGLIGHLGEPTVMRGMIAGAFVWVGFVFTSIAVSYAFQGARWSLILIDSGHWLLVLLVMGAVIGWLGV